MSYGNGTNRFSQVQLGDCADAYRVDPNADPFEVGHLIGAAIFRSPEANLQLRWGTATDIWSFGATVSMFDRHAYDWLTPGAAHKSHLGPIQIIGNEHIM